MQAYLVETKATSNHLKEYFTVRTITLGAAEWTRLKDRMLDELPIYEDYKQIAYGGQHNVSAQ